jgi:ribose transport system substrate-binding protein
MPKVDSKLKIGGVSKTLTNEYWRSLGEGYQNVGKKYGFTVAYQAAANEDDQLGQLSIAETLISQGLTGCWYHLRPISTLNPLWKVPPAKNSRGQC